ncbi:Hpt domain-containing protein [Nocardioides rubriscoriae]|uniref:Hpt domain-containing protein n=1 Tax=Nocardioides rubriscoriae TaxID=642762 RepID=UPI0014787312|nr:Hpt domain-containing protein [Nocardioides rubriscoriae]
MTAFDPSRLLDLVDDASQRPFVLELARTYRRMLEPRVARVLASVGAGDVDEAMDAVLSLKVSSTMTGADELSGLAAHLETDLRRGDLRSAGAQALLLPDAAQRAATAIDTYLAQDPTAAEAFEGHGARTS